MAHERKSGFGGGGTPFLAMNVRRNQTKTWEEEAHALQQTYIIIFVGFFLGVNYHYSTHVKEPTTPIR
jgi:hypothetical protein